MNSNLDSETGRRPVPLEAVRDLRSADFAVLAAWLYKKAGVHLAPAKQAMVQARLMRRLRATRIGSFQEYVAFATTNDREAQWVVDLLTTHETRFFREASHFAYLQQTFLPQWTGPLRVWSAASSTGQEAYSLAMLLQSEVPNTAWSIFGTDISEDSIAFARRADYLMAVADQIPRAYLKRFCLRGTGPRDGWFRIDPTLREKVRFHRTSLLEPDFDLQFELVFLKNVLIYFDETSRERALQNVWSRLVCGGALFLGAAETLRGTSIDAEQVHHGVYVKRC